MSKVHVLSGGDPPELGEVNPAAITGPHGMLPATVPAAPPRALAPQPGFFSTLMNTVSTTASAAVNALDQVGRTKAALRLAKARAQGQADQVRDAWDRNILDRPPSWIPGIPNGAVIGAAAGLGLLLVLMRRKP